ncbi:hypothetical protein [Haladaptatus sp. AB618]|uniref:hypothetical protein n=1 Tax=Haladaptatus sp. AB618 TaxID=2934173 RepID=UPI00209BF12C|nr:hypothetical protein [Haladaptatus sp. AB618]
MYEELAEQNIRYLLTQLSVHSNIGQRITQLPIPTDHAGLPPKAYNYLSDILLEVGQESDQLDYKAILDAVDETYWNFVQVAANGVSRGIDALTKREQAEYLHDRELLAGGFATGGLRRLVTLACYRPYEAQFREKYGTTIDHIIGLIDALADPISDRYDRIIPPQQLLQIYLKNQLYPLDGGFERGVKNAVANCTPDELDSLWFSEEELWRMAESSYDSRTAFSNALDAVTIDINAASGKASSDEPKYGFTRPYRLPRDVGTTERYVFIRNPGDPDEYFLPLIKRAYEAVLMRFWTEIDRSDSDDREHKWGNYVEDLAVEALHRLLEEAEIYDELYYTDENGNKSEVDIVVLVDDELFHFACKSRDLKPATRAGIDAVGEIERDVTSESGIAGGIKQSRRLARSILSGETTKLSGNGQDIDVSHINSEDDFHSIIVFGAHYDQVAIDQYDVFLDNVDPVYVTDIYSLDMLSRIEDTYPQSMWGLLNYVATVPSIPESSLGDLTQSIQQIRGVTQDEYLSYCRFRNWCYELEQFSITNNDEADVFYAYRYGLLGYAQTTLFHQLSLPHDNHFTSFASIARTLTESNKQAQILLETLKVDPYEWDHGLYLTSSKDSNRLEFKLDNTTGDAGTLLRLSTVGAYLNNGKFHPLVSTT